MCSNSWEVINRTLTNWNQTLLQWNDTSDDSVTTTTYNITGLMTNAVYYVYNDSVLAYTLDSGSSGEISLPRVAVVALPISANRNKRLRFFKATAFTACCISLA